MGCAPSSLNNNMPSSNGRTKACTCQCHNDAKTMPVKSVTSSINGVENGSQKQTTQESMVFKDDPRIPLSGRQIFLIKRSWKGISRNMSITGINMFLSLFEKNADLLRLFTSLKSCSTLSELRNSSVLEDHVRGVMMTIDEAITNLDDADYTINMLRAVGLTHTRLNGFNPHAFLLLKEPFLLAARDTLGDRYTAHMQDIYDKAILFILTTLVEGFDSAHDAKPIPISPDPHKVDGTLEVNGGDGHAAMTGIDSQDRRDDGSDSAKVAQLPLREE